MNEWMNELNQAYSEYKHVVPALADISLSGYVVIATQTVQPLQNLPNSAHK